MFDEKTINKTSSKKTNKNNKKDFVKFFVFFGAAIFVVSYLLFKFGKGNQIICLTESFCLNGKENPWQTSLIIAVSTIVLIPIALFLSVHLLRLFFHFPLLFLGGIFVFMGFVPWISHLTSPMAPQYFDFLRPLVGSLQIILGLLIIGYQLFSPPQPQKKKSEAPLVGPILFLYKAHTFWFGIFYLAALFFFMGLDMILVSTDTNISYFKSPLFWGVVLSIPFLMVVSGFLIRWKIIWVDYTQTIFIQSLKCGFIPLRSKSFLNDIHQLDVVAFSFCVDDQRIKPLTRCKKEIEIFLNDYFAKSFSPKDYIRKLEFSFLLNEMRIRFSIEAIVFYLKDKKPIIFRFQQPKKIRELFNFFEGKNLKMGWQYKILP